MDVKWFNALFKNTFYENCNNDNVMNRVINYVNNGSCDDDDSGNTDNDDNDDGDNASYEEGESFSMREFDCRKLILYTAKALSMFIIIIYIKNLVWFHTT